MQITKLSRYFNPITSFAKLGSTTLPSCTIRSNKPSRRLPTPLSCLVLSSSFLFRIIAELLSPSYFFFYDTFMFVLIIPLGNFQLFERGGFVFLNPHTSWWSWVFVDEGRLDFVTRRVSLGSLVWPCGLIKSWSSRIPYCLPVFIGVFFGQFREIELHRIKG